MPKLETDARVPGPLHKRVRQSPVRDRLAFRLLWRLRVQPEKRGWRTRRRSHRRPIHFEHERYSVRRKRAMGQDQQPARQRQAHITISLTPF